MCAQHLDSIPRVNRVWWFDSLVAKLLWHSKASGIFHSFQMCCRPHKPSCEPISILIRLHYCINNCNIGLGTQNCWKLHNSSGYNPRVNLNTSDKYKHTQHTPALSQHILAHICCHSKHNRGFLVPSRFPQSAQQINLDALVYHT